MRLYLAGLIFTACGAACLAACGADSASAPDGGTPSRSLTILSDEALGLGFGQRAQLRVGLTEENGGPVAGATVSFTIVASFPDESAGGATLSAASATTSSEGEAQVDLVAGAARASFRVMAEAENAGPVTFHASVSDGGFADLSVSPTHVGSRSATSLGSVEVRLYATGTGCAALPPESPPPSTYPTRTVDDGDSATFSNLLANEGFSALAFAKSPSGDISAAGCVDLAAGQLRPGVTARLALPVADRPLALAARYQLTSTVDLVPVRQAVVGPGSAWAILACPRGAAQLVLDCAIDLLDGGDPDDCSVAVPGPLAAKLQAARGDPNASGCRGSASTIDGQVMTLLAAASGSPASHLAAAANTLVDLLDAVSLDATLAPDGAVAHLALGTIGLEALGARFQDSLAASSRAIVAAPMALGLTDGVVTLSPAQLSLRLGPFVAASFASQTGLGSGADIVAGLLGDGGAACADVSASACGAVDEPNDCLAQACRDARALVARAIDEPFTALTLAGADIDLDGSVLADGDGSDLAAASLTNGVWRATIHLSTTADILVSGVFDGQAQNL